MVGAVGRRVKGLRHHVETNHGRGLWANYNDFDLHNQVDGKKRSLVRILRHIHAGGESVALGIETNNKTINYKAAPLAIRGVSVKGTKIPLFDD